ncbi:MAG: TolC family protein [Isosphaeraceae bacterium]
MRAVRRVILTAIAFPLVLAGPGARWSAAQVTLADDIIFATQGKENAAKSQRTALGRIPGTRVSPYRRSPGSTDVQLGLDPRRTLAPFVSPVPQSAGSTVSAGLGSGSRRSFAETGQTGEPPGRPGMSQPGALSARTWPGAGFWDTLDSDEGSPDGLTLDQAIERVVRCNPELRSKYLEIPQAQADVLTEGLRENPLLFYSSDGVPYGGYSRTRPGDINHGVSVVFPIDYSGKRRARTAVAEREKSELEAQYRNAVRQTIDEMGQAYVRVLVQRRSVRSAGQTLGLLDQLLARARAKVPRGDEQEELIDDLTIERELAAKSWRDEKGRYEAEKEKLGDLLDLSDQETQALELRGAIHDLGPRLPPIDVLISIALGQRPDLAAYHLGTHRAQAMLIREQAERFPNAYFLYTPFEYRDNSQVGQNSARSWGAGLFVSAPLFNHNQGNLKRARLNIDQSQIEAAAMEKRVIAEVRQAAREFDDSYEDASRWKEVVLPAVRRKSDRAWRRYASGKLAAREFLDRERENGGLLRQYADTLGRHRLNALKVNTAVGRRVLP